MADEETEYGFFKWLLYVILFIAQLIVLLNNVGLMSYWIRSFGKLFKHGGIRGFSLRSEFGSMSIVLPCFMPNEHLIVKETLKQLFNVLEYENIAPGLKEDLLVTVYCPYNAPPSWRHPIEQELAAMSGRSVGSGTAYSKPCELMTASRRLQT